MIKYHIMSIIRMQSRFYWLVICCLCIIVLYMQFRIFSVLYEHRENYKFGYALHEKFIDTDVTVIRLHELTDFSWDNVCFYPDFPTVQRLEFRNIFGSVKYNLNVTSYDLFDPSLSSVKAAECITSKEAIFRKHGNRFSLEKTTKGN